LEVDVSGSTIGNCPVQQHPVTMVTDLSNLSSEWNQTGRPGLPGPLKLLAPPYARGGKEKWLAPFWPGEDYRDVAVFVDSCGVNENAQPVTRLEALVRVYRDDDYSLSIKIPPLGAASLKGSRTTSALGTEKTSFSAEGRMGSLEGKAERSTTRTEEAGTDLVKTTTMTGYGGESDEFSTTTGTKDGKAAVEYSLTTTIEDPNAPRGVKKARTYTATVAPGEKLAFTAEDAPMELKPEVKFTRNGGEIDLGKFINDILNLKAHICEAFNNIENWVPKIGWSASLEIAILEGTIEGKWGSRIPKSAPASDRYAPVETWVSIGFEVKVIEVTLTASFGIDFSSPDLFDWFGVKPYELILKATGSIGASASLSAKVEVSSIDPMALPDAPKTEGGGKPQFNVHGLISVMGYRAEAKGGIEGGIKIECELRVSLTVVPHIKGNMVMEETKIYAYYVDTISGARSGRYDRKLFDERELWKGTLPEI
ncbi:MAG: hypothetical protein O7F71_17050, partial [Gammaproteobacteria bacterium]|nr:hypothetical protein [Gammaproteobacteria bacterium]